MPCRAPMALHGVPSADPAPQSTRNRSCAPWPTSPTRPTSPAPPLHSLHPQMRTMMPVMVSIGLSVLLLVGLKASSCWTYIMAWLTMAPPHIATTAASLILLFAFSPKALRSKDDILQVGMGRGCLLLEVGGAIWTCVGRVCVGGSWGLWGQGCQILDACPSPALTYCSTPLLTFLLPRSLASLLAGLLALPTHPPHPPRPALPCPRPGWRSSAGRRPGCPRRWRTATSISPPPSAWLPSPCSAWRQPSSCCTGRTWCTMRARWQPACSPRRQAARCWAWTRYSRRRLFAGPSCHAH